MIAMTKTPPKALAKIYWIPAAEIQFLSDAAPVDLLQPGNQFELYEGRRVVARGEILGSVSKSSSVTALSQPETVLQEVAES